MRRATPLVMFRLPRSLLGGGHVPLGCHRRLSRQHFLCPRRPRESAWLGIYVSDKIGEAHDAPYT